MTEFLLFAFILLVAGVVSVPIASRFGLELEPKRLWAMRKRMIGLGGGQSGIRTLEGLAPLPVFKTGAFNHSANCPFESPASVSFRHCHPQTSA